MFPQLAAALATCKLYCGIAADDPTWDAALTAFLQSSKGTESFRPLAIAALQVWQFSAGIARGGLASADGATWLNPDQIKNAIQGYLVEQEALDCALTGIPPYWSISQLRARLCSCDGGVAVFGAAYA